jgi:hypothetical protein
MTDQLPPEPLPITARVIYNALLSIFPDHALSILAAIKKVILIKQKMQGFSTMGITAEGFLIIDEEFWNTHMTNLASLKTVLMHELMHNIGGDVFNILPPDPDNPDTELKNMADLLAMDARINAYICNTRPDINPELFLTKFYDDESMKNFAPHKLLRPGVKFETPDEVALLKPIHNMVYSTDEFCPHHEASEKIFEFLKKAGQGKGNKKKLVIKLLGGHGAGSGGSEITQEDLDNAESIEIDMSGLTKEELEKMKEEAQKAEHRHKVNGDPTQQPTPQEQINQAVVEALTQKSTSSQGAGNNSQLTTSLLNQALHVTEKFDLNRFKKLAFDNIFHNVRTQAKVKVGSWSTKPLLPHRPAKSDIILMSAGVFPVLYKQYKYTHKIDKNLLPIYLDVSGSTTPFLPEIIRLIANVSDQLDYVWGFSNKIAKHTVDDLNNGKIVSTGGTDFDCVIDHAEKEGFEHIVVITDGDAYTKYSYPLKTIKTVVTILFGYNNKNNFFTQNFGNTHDIEEVKI